VQKVTATLLSSHPLLFSGSMAGLVLVFGLLISFQFGRLDMQRRQSIARSQATHDLATIRARLEGIINTVFSATSGLSEVIAHQGGIGPDLFTALARQAIKGHPQIRNIVVAPDNRITLVAPLEGNRPVLGLDYATIPEQYPSVQRAMQTGRPVFSGPHNLVQGGRGIIARVPVFTSEGMGPGEAPRYWGLVSVVTDIDALLENGGIRSAETLEVGVRKLAPQGQGDALIWGDEPLFSRQPVSMEVAIPGGTWQIAAVPKGGWPRLNATSSLSFYIGLANSFLAAALTWWLVIQPYRVRVRNQELQQQIADRIRAEEELRLSEQKYAAIFHLMPDMAGISRLRDGRFLEINAGFSRITGWQPPELLDRTSVELELWTAEARSGAMAKVREQGWLENYEFVLRTRSGEQRHALMFLVPIKVRGEEGLFFIARDITELKQAQHILENERARLRNLLQTIPALIWMKDPQGIYLFCNARFERFFGFPEERIMGKTDYDFVPPDQADSFREHDRRAIIAAQPCINEEWITYTDDGHRELLETIKTPVYDSAHTLLGVLGVAWDITEKKRIEEELRKERARFVNLVDSVDGIVWEAEAQTLTFTYVSKQAERLLGYPVEAWYGEGFWLTHLHPDDRDRVRTHTVDCTARGEDHDLEYRFIARDGAIFWIQDFVTVVRENGVPRWQRGIMVDITARKEEERKKQKLEAQLRQAQKMEAVGRLAGGVAHDFNNKLSVILGYADLITSTAVPADRLGSYLNQIIKAATQSRDITRQLLAFSRQEVIAPRLLDLNALVKSVQKGLGRFIREDISFEVRLAAGLWPIFIDPTQADQVIMNLIVNARDAMADGGQLVVETRNISLDAAFCRQHPELGVGDYVELAVSDTGCGMGLEAQQHIFEPFYTTKETGQGTGLGLATVYGIVSQNRGLVLVESAPSQGATFRVFFRRGEMGPPEEVVEHLPPPRAARRTARILLVEDEETVRQMAADMLELSGYTTLVAMTPQQALALCAEQEEQIDLLLTDVIMPEMNGRELSRQIESMRPGIKVLYMSGYAADILPEIEGIAGGSNFIQKPFSLRTLLEKIEQRLHGEGNDGS